MQPHRNKYWLFPKIDDQEEWNAQVVEVCSVYREAVELHRSCGIHTVSIDEQTGIQALQRIARDLLPKSGMFARREYEYIRHGTLGLFGNLHVATGQILSPLIRATRTEEDFVENIAGVVHADPRACWRFVTDNLNTHCSESLVVYVARQCGIDTDLGVKGRRGILRDMASRREFLSDPSHRLRFIYTPSIAVGSTKSRSGSAPCERKSLAMGHFHRWRIYKTASTASYASSNTIITRWRNPTAGPATEACCASRQPTASIQHQLQVAALVLSLCGLALLDHSHPNSFL